VAGSELGANQSYKGKVNMLQHEVSTSLQKFGFKWPLVLFLVTHLLLLWMTL